MRHLQDEVAEEMGTDELTIQGPIEWREFAGLYESSRAVNMVDGLPRAPSFSKPNHSFGIGLLVPLRSFQKLQIGITAVSGASLTAIFFFAKESDMCRLSAKFRVFLLEISSL